MAFEFQLSEQHSTFGPVLGLRQQIFRGYYRFCPSSAWEPPVNVYEDGGTFYICMELAGLERSEVTVEVMEQEIRISGERPVPVPCEKLSAECILRIEIDSGRFFRAIRLPEQAALDSTAAQLERGFLWITVTKRPKPQP